MSGEGEKSNYDASSWWEGWVQSAKDKSASVLQLVKKDLVEFGNVMQCDGSRVANVVKEKFNQETAASASKKVKEGMTSLWGGLSKALVVPPDDDSCYEVIRITDGKPIAFDRVKAQLHALQINIATYSEDPVLNDNKFQQWVDLCFDLEQVKPEISDLLVTNSNVRSLYTQLVPLKVSNIDFWSRYFYKKHLLDEEENRRVALVKRAEIDENELTWDEEEDSPLRDLPTTHNDVKQLDTLTNSGCSGDSNLKQGDLDIHSKDDILKAQTQQPYDIRNDVGRPPPSEEDINEKSIENLAVESNNKLKITDPDISGDDTAAGESPSDDWEKVCSGYGSQKEPGWNDGSNPNEDWEEW